MVYQKWRNNMEEISGIEVAGTIGEDELVEDVAILEENENAD